MDMNPIVIPILFIVLVVLCLIYGRLYYVLFTGGYNMKIPFGQKYEDGEWKDINAEVTETSTGISIRGENPFGGIPISFVPIPEGFKGKSYIYKQKTLSEIVKIEENTVFRMGSVPTCYYEYKDGYCHGYYSIEEK